MGDFNTYFEGDESIKRTFLDALRSLFDDSELRNMVLEVNDRSEYVYSMVRDLQSAGSEFI